ncbi:MAG: hypothetical protein EA405_08250 [Rhodospirillales bacterium]|nr:MAG: hypothetical protein EA405_08250 [Rhodospirillales bacterium]
MPITTRIIAAVTLAVALSLACNVVPEVMAADRYARSASPAWKVGRLDPALSQACRRLDFNQRTPLNLYLGFIGEEGRATTGIAQRGWNLRDPLGLSEPELTYHFRNDYTSRCAVYVAGPPRGAR